MRNVAQGIPSEIPFTTEALRATLARIRDEWENYQASRDRDGVYRYLEAFLTFDYPRRRRCIATY
jgi:hypothetical protein